MYVSMQVHICVYMCVGIYL